MRLLTPTTAAALSEALLDAPSGGSSKKAKYNRHKEGTTSLVDEQQLLDYNGLSSESSNRYSEAIAGDRNDDLSLSFKLSLKKRKSME